MITALCFLRLILPFYVPISRLASFLEGSSPSKTAAVADHMSSCLNPILEKGIVDHSIVHRAISEYFTVASKVLLCTIMCLRYYSTPLCIHSVIPVHYASKVLFYQTQISVMVFVFYPSSESLWLVYQRATVDTWQWHPV